jgi:hypothetical protein
MQLRTAAVVGAAVVIATGGLRDPYDVRAALSDAQIRITEGRLVGIAWSRGPAGSIFSALFHRALTGRRASSAVRAAQLSMLRSPDARLRDPRAWSGFQVYAVSH